MADGTNIPKDVSQSTDLNEIVEEIRRLNPTVDIRIANPDIAPGIWWTERILSSIPGDKLVLPKGFEYNGKNGITNKHLTQSGAYASFGVENLSLVDARFERFLMPKKVASIPSQPTTPGQNMIKTNDKGETLIFRNLATFIKAYPKYLVERIRERKSEKKKRINATKKVFLETFGFRNIPQKIRKKMNTIFEKVFKTNLTQPVVDPASVTPPSGGPAAPVGQTPPAPPVTTNPAAPVGQTPPAPPVTTNPDSTTEDPENVYSTDELTAQRKLVKVIKDRIDELFAEVDLERSKPQLNHVKISELYKRLGLLWSRLAEEDFKLQKMEKGSQTITPPEPVVAEPVVAEPVVAEPVVAEPAVAEPVVAEPVVAEPVVAEPVVAEPVVAEPVVAEPVVPESIVPAPKPVKKAAVSWIVINAEVKFSGKPQDVVKYKATIYEDVNITFKKPSKSMTTISLVGKPGAIYSAKIEALKAAKESLEEIRRNMKYNAKTNETIIKIPKSIGDFELIVDEGNPGMSR